jgi:hypothetical protein
MSGASVSVSTRRDYWDSSCEDCPWMENGAEKSEALKHAMDNGHAVEIRHTVVTHARAEAKHDEDTVARGD